MARIIISYDDTNWLKEYENVSDAKADAISTLLADDTRIVYGNFHRSYEDGLREQGRADAIDECIEKESEKYYRPLIDILMADKNKHICEILLPEDENFCNDCDYWHKKPDFECYCHYLEYVQEKNR